VLFVIDGMKSLAFRIVVSVLVCVILGSLIGYITIDAIQSWYPTIQKPSWNPPNWLFGPVWTVMYILMGIAFALLWNSSQNGRNSAILLFIVQFGLNMAWSYIFFNLHLLGWSFIESLIMLSAIGATIFLSYSVNATASHLLVPYFLWVSFASILNGTVWYLNK
jgi:tryptophan-rich sensory protein